MNQEEVDDELCCAITTCKTHATLQTFKHSFQCAKDKGENRDFRKWIDVNNIPQLFASTLLLTALVTTTADPCTQSRRDFDEICARRYFEDWRFITSAGTTT